MILIYKVHTFLIIDFFEKPPFELNIILDFIAQIRFLSFVLFYGFLW